ncbi:MAG: hypothetical protein KUA37_08500 [Desulfomicrobium sp.]|uniref:hypothetical protein n=1 Tax=Hoeflea sp. TaxID=1940281 RepID=UPI0025C09635|nr:hypothetical protein [Hoeflea sp.]MBU4527129.1 hypothetical protein [Alphaproteobacteria bacterium]MBV1712030.1 hypothetical protein [Desulfomicrobium sp.]MBU4544974.1 hypothetical protein [Alphaproteobacteria bacterium]MBU4549386.1 hypothetical protein [Alphaproteobacteria bacterium]MBV1786302.1 hypothetical protein [Hoeflea sp.]
MVLLQTQSKALKATGGEGQARAANFAALTDTSPGTMPLVAIAAGDSLVGISGWADAQADIAALSTEGRMVVAEDSSPSMQFDQPEIVINAVLSVLGAVRSAK